MHQPIAVIDFPMSSLLTYLCPVVIGLDCYLLIIDDSQEYFPKLAERGCQMAVPLPLYEDGTPEMDSTASRDWISRSQYVPLRRAEVLSTRYVDNRLQLPY